jgi:hypothetical protein
MAVVSMGNPKSLTWTGSPAGPLTQLTFLGFEVSDPPVAVYDSGGRYPVTYQGAEKTCTITARSRDIVTLLDLQENLNCVLTNLVAKWESAIPSCDTNEGDDITKTFSRVSIQSVTGIESNFGSSERREGTVVFVVSRAPGGSDPTIS